MLDEERVEEILLEPVITEKSIREQELSDQYSFRVHPDANKIEIRQAVEQKFDVDVEDIRTMNVSGKEKRLRRGAAAGYQSDWKKAMVRISDDDQIEIVEGLTG